MLSYGIEKSLLKWKRIVTATTMVYKRIVYSRPAIVVRQEDIQKNRNVVIDQVLLGSCLPLSMS